MRPHTTLLAAVLISLSASNASAELKLPGILGDGMVLQRQKRVTVWGSSDPAATVTVQIAGKQGEGKADKDGRFAVQIHNLPTGGPYELTVTTSTGDKAVLRDVLVGEVWVCSGQSNMAFKLAGVTDGEKEVAAANYPKMRLFHVPNRTSEIPRSDVNAKWSACTPETAKAFSGVGYFFGRELHGELNVPIGLIDSSFGGTPAEAWTSLQALEAEPAFKPMLDRWAKTIAEYNPDQAKAAHEKKIAAWREIADKAKAEGKPVPRAPLPQPPPSQSSARPANLYNAMIAPITPYAIAGVIWYQGEANVRSAYQYRTLFPAMIRDWRKAWGNPDLPFHFVQLAPFRYGNADPAACAELWEAQLLTLKNVPHTGMAVTTDLANAFNIHPPNKQVVGHRLALWALAKTYGRSDRAYSGPLYQSLEVQGDSAVLHFDHAGSGLISRDGKPLTHFTVAGEDQLFHPADARIVGQTVVVHSSAVKKPIAVRFAWKDTANPNLVNKEGLLASPFRTDSWKGVTEGEN